MTFLLDTSAAIGLIERHDPEIPKILEKYPDDLPAVSVFTRGELLAGLRQLLDAQPHKSQVGRIRATINYSLELPLADFHESTIECFEYVSAFASRKVSHNDQWIISTAIAEAQELITQDEKQAKLMNDPEFHRSILRIGWHVLPCHYVPVGD